MKEAGGIPLRPDLPWDLVRPHTVTGWRHRHAAGCTRNKATVPTGSWCSWKTRDPSHTQLPTLTSPLPPGTGTQEADPNAEGKGLLHHQGLRHSKIVSSPLQEVCKEQRDKQGL